MKCLFLWEVGQSQTAPRRLPTFGGRIGKCSEVLFYVLFFFSPLVANVANHVGNCLLISGGEGTPTCDTNYHVTGAEREREIKVRVKNILERPLCPTGQYVLDLKNSFKAPGRLFKKQNFQIHICKKIKKIVQFFL